MSEQLKTFRSFLEELPEEIKNKAINNIGEDNIDNEATSIQMALLSGFDWSESPEGLYYWEIVFNEVSGEEDSNMAKDKVFEELLWMLSNKDELNMEEKDESTAEI